MAKCSLCGRGKGKRTCPVRGALCPACCGAHRRRDLACPDDCGYLLTEVDAVNEAYRRAAAGLRVYLFGEDIAWAKRAWEAFLDGDPAPAPWDESCHFGFAYLGWQDERGERGVDRFLRAHRAHLPSDETAALEALRDRTWVSLFEIAQVIPETGLHLVDRLSGERVFVRERSGTRGAAAGDHLIAWVAELGVGAHVLTGAVCAVPTRDLETVRGEFVDGSEAGRREHPEADVRTTARRCVPRVHRALRHAIGDVAATLFGPGSDGSTIFRAHYEATDPEAILARLVDCPDLERVRDGLFIWHRAGSGPKRGPEDYRGDLELRTVRLSLTTTSRGRLDEGKVFVNRLLGKLVRPRAEEDIDAAALVASRAIRPPDAAEAGVGAPASFFRNDDADDVAGAIGGFHRELGGHIRRSEALAPESAPGEAATPSPGDGSDPEARRTEHRLPRMAHEAMDDCVRGFGRAVKEVLTWLRGEPSLNPSRTLTPPVLQRAGAFQLFLKEYAIGRVESGVSEETARADVDFLGHHFLYAVNHELHGRKTFWVDEALAWMLGQTELDIVGRCLRLPFPACAFVFTDRSTLELGESLLALDPTNHSRDRKLAIMTAYLIAQETGEDETRPLDIHLLFDARRGEWPYQVGRSLHVRPDAHLDAILDSHHPDVPPERLDAFFQAPELKRLVHRVLNAVLYATSAHLEPIVLPPASVRLEREARREGGAKRRRSLERLLRSGSRDSRETVFFLPGYIDISRVRRFAELERTEGGRALMSRFMVRGHWRRAAAGWKDQGLRWIRPFWKGPEMAAAVERAYRLKP
ncbi:MAG: hypothetical protein HY905_12410 [Deltaproteobacteria bacterium]|nr:hypothetical protein [Deltaproteobacteria bacterium]